MIVRTAQPADYPAIAELTVSVYRVEGLAGDGYEAELVDVAGRASHAVLLVAEQDGLLIGSVVFAPAGSPLAEIARGPQEAAFRMLVVAPDARGRRVGEQLVQACVERARSQGTRRLVISTVGKMPGAVRLYDRLGFYRVPERDWSPSPGVDLLCLALDL